MYAWFLCYKLWKNFILVVTPLGPFRSILGLYHNFGSGLLLRPFLHIIVGPGFHIRILLIPFLLINLQVLCFLDFLYFPYFLYSFSIHLIFLILDFLYYYYFVDIVGICIRFFRWCWLGKNWWVYMIFRELI